MGHAIPTQGARSVNAIATERQDPIRNGALQDHNNGLSFGDIPASHRPTIASYTLSEVELLVMDVFPRHSQPFELSFH